MCEVARRHTLADIHAFIGKHATDIDSWLPAEVLQSIADLERVVTESVVTTARPQRGQHQRRHAAPVWQNKNWDNFRSFKPTKVLSSETPASLFRGIFNKMTEKSLSDTIKQLIVIMGNIEGDVREVCKSMASVVLSGTAASPGSAPLHAQFLHQCRADALMSTHLPLLAQLVVEELRTVCVKQTAKATRPEDATYDALCAANAINDRNTAYLRLAVLCERQGVLSPGSTAVLMKRLANRLAKLGATAEDKTEAEVLVVRLVSAQEALGGPPSDDVRAGMDKVLANCGKRSEYPGLGNKVRFTLMDYYDTLG